MVIVKNKFVQVIERENQNKECCLNRKETHGIPKMFESLELLDRNLNMEIAGILQRINQIEEEQVLVKRTTSEIQIDVLKQKDEFNRIEVEVIEQMRMANKLLQVHGRKEVKNVNLVKNFISTFEDRFIAILNFNNDNDENQKDQYHLVVLK